MATIVSLVALLLFLPASASAQLVISEIMYDLSEGADGGREWVEIYNESGTAIDVTIWKFLEGTTNHGIAATGASGIPANSYAVIADNPAKFKTDWPDYSGLLFDSAFSLNNTGETLTLRCCGKELSDKDSVSYSSAQGGAGDGSSLSRSGSSFVATSPTPGAPPAAAQPAPEEKKEPAPVQKLPEPPPPQEEKKAAVKTETETQKQEKPPEKEIAPAATASVKKKTAPLVESEPVEEVPESEKPDVNQASQVAAVSAADTGNQWVWWVGAFGIAAFGATGAYVAGRRRTREWTIVEETGEDV